MFGTTYLIELKVNQVFSFKVSIVKLIPFTILTLSIMFNFYSFEKLVELNSES